MGKSIPFTLNPAREIDIDGAQVAAAFDLDVETFQTLLNRGAIRQLCERGMGSDAGLYRASFYLQRTRVRLVVDAKGRIQGEIESRLRS